MEKQIKITMTERQADVVEKALDLYSRIICGQFCEILSVIRHNSPHFEMSENSEGYLLLAQQTVFPELGHSHGGFSIGSVRAGKVAHVAYDIQQAIRHERAWERDPNGGIQVDFDTPQQYSDIPLPKVDVLDGDMNVKRLILKIEQDVADRCGMYYFEFESKKFSCVIERIKSCKQISGMRLVESKNFVEKYYPEMGKIQQRITPDMLRGNWMQEQH